MSQRFKTDFKGDPFGLFRTLYEENPAPFFSYIHAGDHHVLSTSPERFILRQGNFVEARPIKGTRPRGKTPEEDETLKQDLLESEKDGAELSMIVDLLRNDLGKVCQGGTVQVAEHKRLEVYENVYHLVSIVKGTLAERFGTVDLLRAVFPGGSITGCPKIRSMEIIDELEPNRRHVYTGSIGYVGFHETMDLSIAIRTATIVGHCMVFSVGGGVVFDSDPMEEYNETLHKGKTLMEVFRGGKRDKAGTGSAWINGLIRPMHEAAVSITDLGFQYGFGFFETLRVQEGEPRFLADHRSRFNRAWEALFKIEPPDITWDEVIRRVVEANGLLERVAAVKIMASWGSGQERPFDHTLAVTAREYQHRLTGRTEKGLSLVVYPQPRQTPLAEHKTLNYLYYFLAGRWAREKGADEALILNPDGSLSETHSANILCIKGERIVKPISPHVLPGIMEKQVSELLVNRGYRMEERALRPGDLMSFDHVLVTNSLMGAVPVLNIDHVALKNPSDLCNRVNTALLEAG